MRLCESLALTALIIAVTGCQPADIPSGAAPSADNEIVDTQTLSWNPNESPASTADASQSRLAEFDVPVPPPSEATSVTFGLGLSPGSAAVGSMVTVAIRVRMADGWQIYAIDKPTDVQIPTKLQLELPAGIEAVGDWDIPAATALKPGVFGYTGDVMFRRQIRIPDSVKPGLYDIRGEVRYQACTKSMCTRPTNQTVAAALEVSAAP